MVTAVGDLVIGYMPQLLPGELLYSLLARTAALNAIAPPRRSIEYFFGVNSAIPSIDLPAHLEAVHSNLGQFSPCDSPRSLLETGTTYPYYRPFLTPERDEQVQQVLLHSGGSKAKLMLGTIAHRFGAQPSLKYCPLCLVDDIANNGAGYWHTEHHLPDVTCCAIHDVRLVEHVLDDGRYRNRQRLLAAPGSPPSPPTISATAPTAQEFTLAVLSRDALAARLPPTDSVLVQLTYMSALGKAGFLGNRHSIDYPELSVALRNFHADFLGLPHAERLLSTDVTPLAWLHGILERPDRVVHPVCHLLLIQFLFGGVEAYERALKATGDWGTPPSVQTNVGVSLRSAPKTLDNEHLFNTSISCRQAAHLSGISVGTVVSRRRAAGLPISTRRKKLTQDLITAMSQAMDSNVPMSAIAGQFHVSLPTTYRVLRETPGLVARRNEACKRSEREWRRRGWLLAIEHNPKMRISDLRSTEPATFEWLYRNDREWLRATSESLPRFRDRHPRVDWRERDTQLCMHLQERAKRLQSEWQQRRIGKSRLLEYVGEAMVRKNEVRLPKLCACIAQILEPPTAFATRRVDAAIAQLIANTTPLSPWRVLRKAGGRSPSQKLRRYVARKIACSRAGRLLEVSRC